MRQPCKGHGMGCLCLLPKPNKGGAKWYEIHRHTRWFNIVKNLTNHIIDTNRKVFFDNYFMSVPLLLSMLAQHLLGCGTIRPHRIGYPKKLSKLKKMKRRVQNYAEWSVYGYCMTGQEIGSLLSLFLRSHNIPWCAATDTSLLYQH